MLSATTQRAAKCEAQFAKPGTLGRNIERRSGVRIYANDRPHAATYPQPTNLSAHLGNVGDQPNEKIESP